MLIREVHRIQNQPGTYGFLAGLIVMLLGLLVNASCATVDTTNRDDKYGPDEPYGEARGLFTQARSAVKISTECGSGTGVLVDQKHVLTAHHVLNCAPWPKTKFSAKAAVQLYGGVKYEAAYDKLDGKMDIAKLELPEPLDVIPVRLARAKLGDIVCMATAVPERLVKCAKVVVLRDSKSTRDIGTEHDNIWFGNSGSGVYNSDGELVGIASALRFCNPADKWLWEELGVKPERVCGGFATSIPEDMW